MRYIQLLDSTAAGIEGKEVGQQALQRSRRISPRRPPRRPGAGAHLSGAVDDGGGRPSFRKPGRNSPPTRASPDTDYLTQLRKTGGLSAARCESGLQGKGGLRLLSTLVVLHIDRFKDTNDRHGHVVGRQCAEKTRLPPAVEMRAALF